MSEIQLSFFSLMSLFDRNIWIRFFGELERLLNAKLTRLDTNDPMRNKVGGLDNAADFVCSIDNQESSRKLFGKLDRSKIEFSISLYMDTSLFPNNISIYLPEKFLASDEGSSVIESIFVMANQNFKPFYSIGDSMNMISSKRKASGLSVDLQTELIGVFWLTYLNRSYVNYFSKQKFEGLPCRKIEGLDGIMIILGESPISSELALGRGEAESLLGEASFVDPSLAMDKPIGKNALMFSQIEG